MSLTWKARQQIYELDEELETIKRKKLMKIIFEITDKFSSKHKSIDMAMGRVSQAINMRIDSHIIDALLEGDKST